ncbi:MAG: right-handed parallel beta-helix repeat-containing protein [Methanospirillaceae archaeon]|nr:right-handed parallel beta-helix repeat-containing protein [Methanospirillaceae archaeon]
MNGSSRYPVSFLFILLFITPCFAAEPGFDLIFVDLQVTADSRAPLLIPYTEYAGNLLSFTATIRNSGDSPAPQYYISYYLSGDEYSYPGLYIGEIGGMHMKGNEEITQTNSLPMPMNVKPGKYRMVGIINPIKGTSEKNTDNNHITTPDSVPLGEEEEADEYIPVTGPVVIKEPGVYQIQNDFSSGKMYAIEIQSSGVTIDGGGHAVTGVNNRASCGVYVNGKNPLQDILIKDLFVQQFGDGIWLYEVRESTVTGCTISSNDDAGIRLDKSLNNIIHNNIITGNKYGIGVFQSSANTFFDNYLANQYNVIIPEKQTNFWNTTKQSARSVIGGQTLGGNAWDNPSGTGFYTTVTDADKDGIGDYPYAIDAENIDYLPLSGTSAQLPFLSIREELTTPDQSHLVVIQGEYENPLRQSGSGDTKPKLSAVTPIEESDQEDSGVFNGKSSAGPDLLFSDIHVVSVKTSDDGIIDDTIPVTGTIDNPGTKATDTCKVYFYLSKDEYPDENDSFVGSVSLPPLPPGEQYTITHTINIPAGISNGLYSVIMVADPQRIVFERDETNNKAVTEGKIKITQNGIEDYIQKIGLFAEKPPETLIESGVSQGMQELFSTEPEETGIVQDNQTIPVLKPDSSMLYPVLPDNDAKSLMDGTEDFGSEPEEKRSQSEITGDEEVVREKTTVSPPSLAQPIADISATGLRAVTPGIIGDPIAIEGSLENLGDRATESFLVSFYYSPDKRMDADDILIGSSISRSLCPGCRSYITYSGFIPEMILPGAYYILMQTDSEQKVRETDENNNLFSSEQMQISRKEEQLPLITDPVYRNQYLEPNESVRKPVSVSAKTSPPASIGGIPSEMVNRGIQLSLNAAPTTLHAGDAVTINGFITNQDLVMQHVVMTYYLSTDTEMSPDDSILGSGRHFFGSPGETATIPIRSYIPSETKTGFYYIIGVVTADTSGSKKEYAVASSEEIKIF